MNYFLILMVFLTGFWPLPAQAAPYGIARSAVPVLNSYRLTDIFGGRDGKSLKTDRCGQVRHLEYIALPGTPFKILEEIRQGANLVYRVETEEYPVPPSTALYVDSRLIEPAEYPPPPRKRTLPPAATIVAALKSSLGAPYVWGGNVRQGLAEMLDLYYEKQIAPGQIPLLTLAGLDCSGLLYQATNGWTPRNTSALISFGRGLAIAGKGSRELATMLQPLDLIVWEGHVVIVLDRHTTIESRLVCDSPGHGGVVTRPLEQRLGEILRRRRPVDDDHPAGNDRKVFTVRRWLAS